MLPIEQVKERIHKIRVLYSDGTVKDYPEFIFPMLREQPGVVAVVDLDVQKVLFVESA